MQRIQVYDPPMCCSTGICGTDIDPALVQFAAMLVQVGQRGVTVERYNLGQQPMAFVQNAEVKSLLDSEGMEVLPLVFVDGRLCMKARYPTETERGELMRALEG